MSGLTVTLALAYAVTLAILISIWVRGQQAMWMKVAVSALLFVFCVASYHGWRQVSGWPAPQVLPEQFLLLSSWVREPDEKTNTQGGIDLWVVTVTDDGPAVHPRAYELPYNTELHQSIEAAERRMGQGRLQMGRRIIEDGRRTNVGAVRLAPDQQLIEFYDVPDPALPEK
ncbi:MAG: hypothetical protein AAF184_13305 [Pseudomonadota bacterium]